MNRSLVVHTVPEEGMKTEEFAQAQAAASRVFGRDKEASVVFQGDHAHVTKDGTIVFPALNDGKLMTKQEVLVARGYADHETAHKRYTDIETTIKFDNHCKNTDNQLLRQVGNAVDDLRVDYLAIRDYSGAQTNIEAATEAVMREFMVFAKDHPDDAQNMDVVMPLMITAEGRRRMGFRSPTLEKALDTLTPENRERINKYTDIAIACRDARKKEGTEQVVDIAKKIIAAKEEVDKENPSDPQPAKEKEKESGTPPDKPDVAEDLGEALRDEAINKVFSQHTKSDSNKYRPFSTAYDSYNRIDNDAAMSALMEERSSVDQYENLVHKMHGKISTMSRKLERALMSMQRRDWQTNMEFGGLDPKRLVQAVMAKPNVYRLKDDRKELDTAVSMMIDLSGSMAGREARLAQEVAIAMCLVMEKVGVAYEVLGWNNHFGARGNHEPSEAFMNANNEARHNPEKHGRFSRFEPIHIYEFKGFEKRLIQERAGMSCIARMAGGNNSDVDAVKVSHQHLRARQESKKILFVLSDGYPACSHTFGSTHQHQHLRNRIEMVGRDRIECVGIGIKSDAVQQFYPKYVVVDDLDDLPKAAFDQIAQLLVGARFKVDNSELMTVTTAR